MKSYKTLLFILGSLFLINFSTNAQTLEELKAMRDELKAELKGNAHLDREKRMEKLKEPGTVNLAAVDQLAASSFTVLTRSIEFGDLVPEMYKRVIGETVDGVTDVTVKKPTLAEVAELGANIASVIATLVQLQQAAKTAAEDVKKASPLQAPKAAKSMNFSREVIELTLPELELNAKVVKNLIETIKSSKNY
jgi:hypothetical protein